MPPKFVHERGDALSDLGSDALRAVPLKVGALIGLGRTHERKHNRVFGLAVFGLHNRVVPIGRLPNGTPPRCLVLVVFFVGHRNDNQQRLVTHKALVAPSFCPKPSSDRIDHGLHGTLVTLALIAETSCAHKRLIEVVVLRHEVVAIVVRTAISVGRVGHETAELVAGRQTVGVCIARHDAQIERLQLEKGVDALDETRNRVGEVLLFIEHAARVVHDEQKVDMVAAALLFIAIFAV